VDDFLGWILSTVESVDPILRTLLAGLGMFLETSILVGLVVPGDSIVLVASTAVEGAVEYFALIATVITASLAGESVGFALGRFFGPRIRASRLGKKVGENHWHRAEIYLDRRGGPAVFISRFLPVFHSLIPVTVGMSTMPYRKFIAWTVPACVIWAFAYVSVGSLAGGGYRMMADRLHSAGYIFVGIIAVFVLLVFVVKKTLAKREERHMRHHSDEALDTATSSKG